MDAEWEDLRYAAKAADREKAFGEHWPDVEAQLRRLGYSSWGIMHARSVLSDGGSVTEAAEALLADEELTEAGRWRVRQLRRLARGRGFVLRKSDQPPFARSTGHGSWMIVDPRSDSIVARSDRTGRPNMNLDDVEAWLIRGQL
jgi:hypothetical protein